MVAADDLPPINDVVFVVEDTAAAGAFISEMRGNYVVPILEALSGCAPASEAVTWASVNCSSTFTLVRFQAADCRPRSAKLVI